MNKRQFFLSQCQQTKWLGLVAYDGLNRICFYKVLTIISHIWSHEIHNLILDFRKKMLTFVFLITNSKSFCLFCWVCFSSFHRRSVSFQAANSPWPISLFSINYFACDLKTNRCHKYSWKIKNNISGVIFYEDENASTKNDSIQKASFELKCSHKTLIFEIKWKLKVMLTIFVKLLCLIYQSLK